MYDDWTKCTECQFFDPEKYYCKRLLHTVTIGCPYGEPKPATNYDLIISKTPEELAQWIMSIEPAACPFREDHGDDCRFTRCTDCWLEWLRQEVKE